MFKPAIENDSFLNNKGTQILRPEEGPFNDHCFARDADGFWHFIDGRHAIGGRSILEPMRFLGTFPKLEADKRKTDIWACCSVGKDDTLHIFFADTIVSIHDGWKDFITYVRQGNPFRLWLARAPLTDFSQLELTDMLFEDDGGSRDPFVFWHKGISQWVMLYAKRLDPTHGQTGESGIAYRLSRDLVDWSERKGYVIRNLYYYDEVRDEVTEAIGNAESPHLVEYHGMYYLFVTHVGYKNYHRTKVWASSDPLNFGPADEPLTVIHAHAPEIVLDHGEWFISNCGIHHEAFHEEGPTARVPGVEIARLLWKNIT